MEVLNTALYYTKVCLGFSFKHEKVDIPKKREDNAERRRLLRLAESRETDAEIIANKYPIEVIRKALEIAESNETGDSSKTQYNR